MPDTIVRFRVPFCESEPEVGERTISIIGASQLVKVRVEDEATVAKSVQLR